MNKKCVCDFKLGNFSCTCGGGKYEIESKKSGEPAESAVEEITPAIAKPSSWVGNSTFGTLTIAVGGGGAGGNGGTALARGGGAGTVSGFSASGGGGGGGGTTNIIPPCLFQYDHEFRSDPQGGAACQVCQTVMLHPHSTVYVYPCPMPRLTGLPVDGYHTWGVHKANPKDYICSGCRSVWKI